MKAIRIYVDTSVLGGCFDAEFVTWSEALAQDFRTKQRLPVLSDVTAAEVEFAPTAVRDLHHELVGLGGEVLPVTTEVLGLIAAYESRKILPKRFSADLTHIALATIAEVDALASWNFRHIVRLDKIRLFNSVNIELGYRPLRIQSPREVMNEEN